MRNFMINVAPKTEGGRIPVALAGQIMMDIQEMLSDIGEYLIRSELGIQNSLRPEILSKFTLFMDGDGGISIGTSTNEHIVGSITEDALDLMEDTMDAMGSGAGGYWMEDNYIDPFFRNHIIYDIVALSEHINGFSDCVLTYGSPDNMKTFGQVDVVHEGEGHECQQCRTGTDHHDRIQIQRSDHRIRVWEEQGETPFQGQIR